MGLALAVPGLAVAAGVLVFLACVHRGPRSEVLVLARVALWAGVLALLGTLVEVAALARLYDDGWAGVLTDRAPAALLRLVGTGLVVVGLFEVPELRPVTNGSVRWSAAGPGVFAAVGAAVGLASFQFDGYTVTRGPRVLHAAASFVHVAAASVWAGGIVALLVVVAVRRRAAAGNTGDVRALTHTLGRIALAALVAVAAAGTVLAVLIVDRPGQLVDTPWGRRLAAKLVLVMAAVGAGAYHHVRTRSGVDGSSVRLDRALTIEAAALLGVLVVTALLVGSSAI